MGVVAKVFDDTLYPCQVQPKENNIKLTFDVFPLSKHCKGVKG
jgi:hypothetical protein